MDDPTNPGRPYWRPPWPQGSQGLADFGYRGALPVQPGTTGTLVLGPQNGAHATLLMTSLDQRAGVPPYAWVDLATRGGGPCHVFGSQGTSIAWSIATGGGGFGFSVCVPTYQEVRAFTETNEQLFTVRVQPATRREPRELPFQSVTQADPGGVALLTPPQGALEAFVIASAAVAIQVDGVDENIAANQRLNLGPLAPGARVTAAGAGGTDVVFTARTQV